MGGYVLMRIFAKTPRIFTNVVVASIRNISEINNEHKVVASADGKVVVCWHPEVGFPYQNSLPVNIERRENLSALKVQNLKEVISIFHHKHEEFVRQELMDLTYTTKHRWFPQGIHKKRRKRNIEESRPYL